MTMTCYSLFISFKEDGNVDNQPKDYHSYLLRLWHTGHDCSWKASLENPINGERQGFNSIEALFDFLRTQTLEISNQNNFASGEE